MMPLIFSSCVSVSYPSVRVVNQSEERIFVQFVSSGYDWEIFRKLLEPRQGQLWEAFEVDSWETLIEEQNGWIVRIYPDSLFSVPHDSLKTIPPLKQWEVAEWKDVENLGGIFEYP
jgi:hypothetical protein